MRTEPEFLPYVPWLAPIDLVKGIAKAEKTVIIMNKEVSPEVTRTGKPLDK